MSGQRLDEDLRRTFEWLGFVTNSPRVLSMLRQARKAAEASDITVLLEGETGTGKQVLAQSIHRLDQKRRSFPFVTVHCSTINESLAESELFGHHRGAFSGALCERMGLFQAAHRGTLFLDDINDLPAHLQPKLLDVVQRGIVRPLGSDSEVPVDVRIIAAANQPLEQLVREGRFRADLYHRLHVVNLALPPLRERPEDLCDLMLSLVARYSHLYQPIDRVEPELLLVLQAMPFPGNVRELENHVQRMLFVKSEGTSLGLHDWMAQVGSECGSVVSDLFAQAGDAAWKAISQGRVSYSQAFEAIEKRVLEAALNAPGSTRREIAQRLQTSERTLYHKLRAHRIVCPPKT